VLSACRFNFGLRTNGVKCCLRTLILKQQKLFVLLLVVLELFWVLDSVYQIPRSRVLDALQNMLLMPVLSFDSQAALQGFIHSAKNGNKDLFDLLIAHAALESGCGTTLTFDKKASGFRHFQLMSDQNFIYSLLMGNRTSSVSSCHCVFFLRVSPTDGVQRGDTQPCDT